MAVHGENQIKLQSLSEKHKQVAALLAQGLGRTEISTVLDFTPEYVTWLARDPLFKDYLRGMSEVVDARLEAMFGLTADVIADGMINGAVDERLKAARLQLEVTGRVGKLERPAGAGESSIARLNELAERLVTLQGKVRAGQTYEGTALSERAS